MYLQVLGSCEDIVTRIKRKRKRKIKKLLNHGKIEKRYKVLFCRKESQIAGNYMTKFFVFTCTGQKNMVR